MYNELLLHPRCNVRNKRFKGALSLLGSLAYVSSQCSMVSVMLGSMNVYLTSTRMVRIYLLIKDDAYVELKKWVKIYQVKKKKQNILGERARCWNEQEMSDRKQLITNKFMMMKVEDIYSLQQSYFYFVEISFRSQVMYPIFTHL